MTLTLLTTTECPVGIANVLRSIIINKTNVPADLHELLSTAKNLPEYNIRTEGLRS